MDQKRSNKVAEIDMSVVPFVITSSAVALGLFQILPQWFPSFRNI